MTKITKQIIIIVVIIIAAFVVYRMFFVGNAPSDTSLVADQTATQEFAEGQAILALLQNLSNVTLDNAIFSDKTFVSLVDFEKPIADQAVGRQNPFLPIGVEGAGTILSGDTSTVKIR